MEVEFTGKCISCRKKFEITPALMMEAKEVGCAISPCCGFPSTLERVTVKKGRSKRSLSRVNVE